MLQAISKITLGQVVQVLKWSTIASLVLGAVCTIASNEVVIRRLTAIAQADSPADSKPDTSTTSPPDSTPDSPADTSTDEPKRFKIQLSLSSPADLKVREGDNVRVGQVLGDRVRDRQRLATQREQVRLQLARVGNEGSAPAIPPVAPLPPPTFLQNLAEIQSQQLKVDEANKQLALQQRKLDFLKGLPEGEVPRATIEHEERKTEERERAVNQAIGQLQLAQSKLAQAQKERAYEEYQHSLEVAKLGTAQAQQRLEREKQQRDRSFQLAQLQSQLASLDNQLSQLSAVRSPYHAVIKKVKWIEQSDTVLRVELTLDLRGNRSNTPADNSTTTSS